MARLTTLAVSTPENAEERHLPASYVNETLSLYLEEFRYLKSASWVRPVIAGEFQLTHYPFTREEHIDYVPASMIMLYLSQLGFVYTRILCEEGILPFTVDQFFQLRNEGRIVFSRFHELRFNNKIYTSEDRMHLSMSVDRFISATGRFVGDVYFTGANGRCMGRGRVAII